MTRKKILFTIVNLNIGGSEMSLYRILQTLDREAYDPVVVSLKGKGDLGPLIEALGVPVHALSVATIGGYFLSIPRLAGLILRERPDLLQGWLYHANLAVLLAKWIARSPAPVCWSIRNTLNAKKEMSRSPWFMRALVALGARLSPSVDTIIFNSVRARDDHEKAGFKPTRAVVMPNGIDPAQWRPDAGARAALRSRCALGDATPIIGLVARYDPTKDHENFLRAAAWVAERHRDVHFVLAGPGVTDANDRLAGLVSRLGLQGRAQLIGQTLNNRQLTQGLDVSCCSSLTESFPNTVLEAMACGVLCVSTDVGDVRTILGAAGFVVPSRDAEALGAALLKAISLPDADRKRMTDLALDAVRTRYSMDAVKSQIQSVYGS